MKIKINKILLVSIITAIALFVAGVMYFFILKDRKSTAAPKSSNTILSESSTYADDTAKTPPTDPPSTTPSPTGPPPDLAAVPELDAIFPVENAHYKISKISDNEYTIVLNAIFNSPSQRASYLEDLRSYKSEALGYLASREIVPSDIIVNYVPEEARDL
jgi:hypothetical protein